MLYQKYSKPILDIILSLTLLIITAPILVVLILLTYIFIGSPILFKQTRPGIHGKPFTIYKFRTMKNSYDNDKQLLADGERLTKFGKLLRSTSLDELPELINVLKGDMSLVGPRPLLMEYLPLYSVEQFRRHDVKPGITGWAQINGRNTITWKEKFALDLWYVDNVSFWVDVKIAWLTFIKVIKRENINQTATITMKKFQG